MRLAGCCVAGLLMLLGQTGFAQPARQDGAARWSFREIALPITGHNYAYLDGLAFSKDGTLLATGADATVVICDVESARVVTRIQLPARQYALNFSFSDDGKTLITNGSYDPMLRFWDVKTGPADTRTAPRDRHQGHGADRNGGRLSYLLPRVRPVAPLDGHARPQPRRGSGRHHVGGKSSSPDRAGPQKLDSRISYSRLPGIGEKHAEKAEVS